MEKKRFLIPCLALVLAFQAQGQTGGFPIPGRAAAEKYADWARQGLKEGRWAEVLGVLERAADFNDVSSDISYLLALARFHEGSPRGAVLEALRKALEVKQWQKNSPEEARFLEAETLVGLGFYSESLEILSGLQENAETERLWLLCLKGMDHGRFTARLEESLDRYPRDPRFARIFLEYLHGRYFRQETIDSRKDWEVVPNLPGEAERSLIATIFKRLPVLLEAESELAWLAAPFNRDIEEARRYVSAYRARQEPLPASIPASLYLGLIGENQALRELFKPWGEENKAPGELTLDLALIKDVWALLRHDEGRALFRRHLEGFSGFITEDEDQDGAAETKTFYQQGLIRFYTYDANQDGIPELTINFEAGEPSEALITVPPETSPGVPLLPVKDEERGKTKIRWEKFPSVLDAFREGIHYIPRPMDFYYAPVRFAGLLGSGLLYPSRDLFAGRISRRTLVSFALFIERSSSEFKGGIEKIELIRGIPRKAWEYVEGFPAAETNFSQGWPVSQKIDLDLDGRMETVRYFRPSPFLNAGISQDDFRDDFLDYVKIIDRVESDWDGDGIFESSGGAAAESPRN
jgi:hypothetical protein